MKKIVFAGTVMGAMMAGPVLAAELPVARPPTLIPVSGYLWTGFYVGVHGGWGFGDVDFGSVNVDTFEHHTMDGGLAGGHIGYSWQMSHSWLIGLEASGTWSGVEKTIITPLFTKFPNDQWTTEVRWLATITPRIGVTISSWLWYLKGGVAFADIRHRLESLSLSVETSDTRVGWTLGFGGEVLLGSNWVLGAEGNFYDFGALHVNSATPIQNFPNHDLDVTMWSILGRLSYKFGGPGQVVARY